MLMRVAGYLLLLIAVVLIGLDGYDWIQSGDFRIKVLGERWNAVHALSLELLQAGIQRYVWPPLWDPGIITILLWPAWVLPLGFGAVLTLWDRRRRGRSDVFGKVIY